MKIDNYIKQWRNLILKESNKDLDQEKSGYIVQFWRGWDNDEDINDVDKRWLTVTENQEILFFDPQGLAMNYANEMYKKFSSKRSYYGCDWMDFRILYISIDHFGEMNEVFPAAIAEDAPLLSKELNWRTLDYDWEKEPYDWKRIEKRWKKLGFPFNITDLDLPIDFKPSYKTS